MEEREETSGMEQKTAAASEVKRELAGPGELLSQAWAITTTRFWPLVACMLIPVVAGIGLALLFIGPLVIGAITVGAMRPANLAGIITLPLVGGVAIMAVAMLVVALWQGIALIELIAGAEGKLGLVDAFKKAWPKIWGGLGVAIIAGMISAGAMLPFILPALAVGVWFAFGQMVFIVEGPRGLKALRISREYVRGRFWGVLGRMLFPMLLFIGLAIIESIIGAGLGKELTAKVEWIFSLINIPASVLATTYQFQLYKNLKETAGGPIDPAEVEAGKGKWIALAVWGIIGWLLIPVGIVALVLLMLNPGAQMQQTRDAQADFNKQIVERSLLMYYTRNMKYPQTLQELMPEYINQLPTDSGGADFVYRMTNGGDDFELCDVRNVCITGGQMMDQGN